MSIFVSSWLSVVILSLCNLSLSVCSTHETVCKFNYILCERKASRQCEKTGDTLDCFDICKRSCPDCMQRVFRQCAAACVS